MRTIYLDYNATTPLDPQVRAAMLPFLEDVWANPSSVHHAGRKARVFLDECRERSAEVLGCKPGEVIFTSGGTESVNLAIFGTARLLKAKGRHLVSSVVEHHAVLHSLDYLRRNEGFEITLLPVDREGRVAPESLQQAIRPDTTLVSIMAANNEIGTIQPVAALGKICRDHGVLFHTDAVQWFGKEPFDSIQQFNADLVTICGHKFHGPKGAGLLFSKSPLRPDPILFGGSHENERRAGTENLSAIAGLVDGLERFVLTPVFPKDRLSDFSLRLTSVLDSLPAVQVVTPREDRLANTIAFLVAGADSISLLANLDLEGVCASSGSACSAGSLEPSHVVSALGVDPSLTNSLVRLSLGRETTLDEIEFTARVLPQVISRAQRLDNAAKSR